MGEDRADSNSAEQPDLSVVDPAIITTLLADLGRERTQEICDVFLQDAEIKVGALQDAVDADDAAAAARIAHGLKSGSGFVGATTLHILGAEMERTARADSLEFVRGHLADLRDGLSRVADRLTVMVGRPRGPSDA